MKHRHWLFAIIIFAGIAVTGLSAQVAQDELRQPLPPVVFINYEGPHARIDTREQIRQLGYIIGLQVSEGEKSLAPTLTAMPVAQRSAYTYKFDIGALNRYFVIHSVSGPEDRKMDADIFGLGVDAGVDHIRNLRTIIQGYLQSAYDYSESDARVLAEFVTIYNAVYRGDWDYFTARYKTQVINNLVKERAGISIRYDEWPGRTMMLIPIGMLGSVDPAAIADSRVIQELRNQDDQGVPQRQGMVGIVEQQAEQAGQQAQQQRQTAAQEQSQIAADRAQTAADRQQIADQRQQVQDDQAAGNITDDQAAQLQQDLDRREQAVEERDMQIAQRQEAVDQRLQDAQQLEDYAAQQTDQAQQMRQDIAADQQAAIAQQPAAAGTAAAAAAPVTGVMGVTIEKTDPTPTGRLVSINPVNGTRIKTSPLNMVHIRTVTFVGGKIIAVAGENVGQGAVRLIEIDQTSLEMAKQGQDDIMVGTLLWVNGSDLYAITVDKSNNNCFLGRFNTDLALQAKSTAQIHPQAGVTIQQGRLLTQRQDGSPLLLNPADLTEILPN
jgi:hypothetical protein